MVKAFVEPPRLLTPPRRSMLSTVGFTAMPDRRHEDGITYKQRSEAVGFRTDSCGPSPGMGASGGPTVIDCAVYVGLNIDCSTFGSDEDRLRLEAEQALDAAASAQLSSELFHGDAVLDACGSEYLTRSPDALNLVGQVHPVRGLAELERFLIGNYLGVRGAIYASARAATWLAANFLIVSEGDLLLTQLGTLVIVDTGWGAGPALEPETASTSWLYAASVPYIERGELVVEPAITDLQARDNTTRAFVYRPYIIDIHTGFVAVANISLCNAAQAC